MGGGEAGGDFGHYGEDVGALAFREVGDMNVEGLVALAGAVVTEGFIEDGADGGVGAVDPVTDDADGFLGVLVLGVVG